MNSSVKNGRYLSCCGTCSALASGRFHIKLRLVCNKLGTTRPFHIRALFPLLRLSKVFIHRNRSRTTFSVSTPPFIINILQFQCRASRFSLPVPVLGRLFTVRRTAVDCLNHRRRWALFSRPRSASWLKVDIYTQPRAYWAHRP